MDKYKFILIIFLVSLILVSCAANMSNISTSAVVYELDDNAVSSIVKENNTQIIEEKSQQNMEKITTVVYP